MRWLQQRPSKRPVSRIQNLNEETPSYVSVPDLQERGLLFSALSDGLYLLYETQGPEF
jgi:hypothetical protein